MGSEGGLRRSVHVKLWVSSLRIDPFGENRSWLGWLASQGKEASCANVTAQGLGGE